MRRLACLLFVCGFALVAAQSLAQERPACHTSDSHAVADLPNEDLVGSRFLVTSAAAGCAKADAEADFVIGDGDEPLWFEELRRDKLFLTRSTGPQGDLIVHDLTSDVRLLDVPSDDFAIHDDSVVYWQWTEQGTAENCPQFAEYRANGFGAAIVEQKRLVFGGAGPEATGERRCDQTQ